MIFPEGGRIVVIDDQESEGLPLVKSLIKKGHLATFFNNTKEDLPSKPLSGIRVVFLDLYLSDAYQGIKTIISSIIGILERLIDKNVNGPFLVIFWTKHPADAEQVSLELKEKGFQFLHLTLEKDECKNAQGKFSVQIIQSKLKTIFENFSSFEVFMYWENLIHKSAGKIVNEFANLSEMNEIWNGEMSHIISKLARSILGEHFNKDNPNEIVENAMFAMNSALIDSIQQETKFSNKTNKINFQPPEVPKNRKKLNVSDGALNNRLLLKKVIGNNPSPGNIYTNHNSLKLSLKTIFNGDFDNFQKKDEISSLIKHVILEVTPACDYAEKKLLTNRVISGVFWPHEYKKNLKSKTEYLYITPVLLDKNDHLTHLVFDFRTFSSLPLTKLKKKKTAYTLQNEILADIQSKLSNHVSRLGTISVN